MPSLKGVLKIPILSLDIWKVFNEKLKMSQCKVSQFPKFQFSLDLKTIQCKGWRTCLILALTTSPPGINKKQKESWTLPFEFFSLSSKINFVWNILAFVHMGMKADRHYITRRELTMLNQVKSHCLPLHVPFFQLDVAASMLSCVVPGSTLHFNASTNHHYIELLRLLLLK